MSTEQHIKYLMTTEQDLSWGVVTTTAGYQDIEAGTPYPSLQHPTRYLFSSDKGRTLNEYQLIYITRGHGTFSSKHQQNIRIEAGDLFLLFPGEWHTYKPNPKQGWYEYWIGFTGQDMDSKVNANFFNVNNPVFKIGFNSELVNLFQLAVQTSKEQQPGYQQILSGIINLLLGFTYSKFRSTMFEDKKLLELINQAKVLIHEHINGYLTGQEIATKIGMSYSSFRRFFKQYTGFAPMQYLQELKISKSKELLTNTSLTCQEIAFEMGFDTPSYFNMVFRKRVGMTPQQYRNMTQGKLRPIL